MNSKASRTEGIRIIADFEDRAIPLSKPVKPDSLSSGGGRMSRGSARLVAAGLWAFGLTALVMLALQLNVVGFALLGMGVASIVTATWINTTTATTSPSPPTEPVQPPASSASAS